MAQHPDMGRQGDEMRVVEIFLIRLVRRDRPEEELAYRRRHSRVGLLGRDDRVFIVDQRIGVRTRRVDEREALVGGCPGAERRGRGRDRLGCGQQKLARVALERRSAERGLGDFRVIADADIGDGIGRLLQCLQHAFIAGSLHGARHRRPGDRGAVADAVLPRRGRERQILAEDKGVARSVGAIDWDDRVVRQLEVRV